MHNHRVPRFDHLACESDAAQRLQRAGCFTADAERKHLESSYTYLNPCGLNISAKPDAGALHKDSSCGNALTMQGMWTHGGSVHGDFGWAQADDGTSLASDIFPESKCPGHICARSNPTDLHIYHYRSPSLEDDIKKAADWHWKEHPEDGLQATDEEYATGTWFFNQMRDVSLLQFSDALRERMLPLLTQGKASVAEGSLVA